MRCSFTHFIIRTPRPSLLSPVTLCFKYIKNIRFFWICKGSSMSKSITTIMFSISYRNTWTLKSKCSKLYSTGFILPCLRIKHNIFWTEASTIPNPIKSIISIFSSRGSIIRYKFWLYCFTKFIIINNSLSWKRIIKHLI
jgi:hypothetical protein